MNKQSLLILATLTAGLGLSACGGNGDDISGRTPQTGALRAVNGITDSTGLDVAVEQSSPPPNVTPPLPPPTTLVPVPIDASKIPFDGASNINALPANYYRLELTPAGTQMSFTDYVPINDENLSTVFTYGTTASYGYFIVQQWLGISLTSGQFAVQFVHDALAESQTVSPICFKLTPIGGNGTTPGAPGTPLPAIVATFNSATSLFNATPSTIVAYGTYSIGAYACVQDPNTFAYSYTGAPFFSSGPKGVVLPPVGTSVLQIAALDATADQSSQYGSPITLLLMDNTGKSTPLYNGKN